MLCKLDCAYMCVLSVCATAMLKMIVCRFQFMFLKSSLKCHYHASVIIPAIMTFPNIIKPEHITILLYVGVFWGVNHFLFFTSSDAFLLIQR